jgi:hypothetical protein
METNYTVSVNNYEALINYVEEKHPDFSDTMLEILRAGVFTLKIQPQYKGELPDVRTDVIEV